MLPTLKKNICFNNISCDEAEAVGVSIQVKLDCGIVDNCSIKKKIKYVSLHVSNLQQQ